MTMHWSTYKHALENSHGSSHGQPASHFKSRQFGTTLSDHDSRSLGSRPFFAYEVIQLVPAPRPRKGAEVSQSTPENTHTSVSQIIQTQAEHRSREHRI